MKKKENLYFAKAAVTNLSKIFKNDKTFVPTKLTVRELETPDTKQSADGHPQSYQESSDNNTKAPESQVIDTDNTVISNEELQSLQNQAYQKGIADTQAKHDEQFHTTLDAFSNACRKIDFLRNTIVVKNKEHMINIIIALTKTIVKQELSVKRDIIASTLEAALEQAIQNDEYQITLHPDDLAIVEEMKPKIIATIRSLEHIVIKIDPKITPGGCVIDSNTCSVDATIETQLKNAKNFLLEHRIDTDQSSEHTSSQNQDNAS